jgi:hypothetical protein
MLRSRFFLVLTVAVLATVGLSAVPVLAAGPTFSITEIISPATLVTAIGSAVTAALLAAYGFGTGVKLFKRFWGWIMGKAK